MHSSVFFVRKKACMFYENDVAFLVIFLLINFKTRILFCCIETNIYLCQSMNKKHERDSLSHNHFLFNQYLLTKFIHY